MLSVKLFSELSPEDQAAAPIELDDPGLVFVTESSPGELGEPRILVRRALYLLKCRKTVSRDPTKAALKAHGLLDLAFLRALSIGTWSQSARPYDPVPDILKIVRLAAKRLGPTTADDHPVARFRTTLEHIMCGVRLRATLAGVVA